MLSGWEQVPLPGSFSVASPLLSLSAESAHTVPLPPPPPLPSKIKVSPLSSAMPSCLHLMSKQRLLIRLCRRRRASAANKTITPPLSSGPQGARQQIPEPLSAFWVMSFADRLSLFFLLCGAVGFFLLLFFPTTSTRGCDAAKSEEQTEGRCRVDEWDHTV